MENPIFVRRQANIESRETLPLANRVVLITGGATGIGAQVAKDISGLGAETILLTRSSEHFANVQKELGETGVFPLIADITNPLEVQEGLRPLENEGIVPTDIVISHAGGMEKFSSNLARGIIRLKRFSGEELTRELTLLRTKINSWVERDMDFATNVNFNGSAAFVEYLANNLTGTPKRLVFVSSFWSSLYGSIKVPSFYEGVAKTKKSFEVWLADNFDHLTENNLFPTILSANLVPDTPVGNNLKDLTGMIPGVHLPNLDDFPKMADVSRHVGDLLRSGISELPKIEFLVKKHDLRSELDPNDPDLDLHLPI